MFSLHVFIVLSLLLPDLRNLSFVEWQSQQNMFRMFDKVDEHLPTWQLLNCIFIVNLVSPQLLTTFQMQQAVNSINIRYWWRKKTWVVKCQYICFLFWCDFELDLVPDEYGFQTCIVCSHRTCCQSWFIRQLTQEAASELYSWLTQGCHSSGLATFPRARRIEGMGDYYENSIWAIHRFAVETKLYLVPKSTSEGLEHVC